MVCLFKTAPDNLDSTKLCIPAIYEYMDRGKQVDSDSPNEIILDLQLYKIILSRTQENN